MQGDDFVFMNQVHGTRTIVITKDNPIDPSCKASGRHDNKQLKDFKEKLYIRVSFKAAAPEAFTRRTGALGQYYELPFKALKYLLEEGIHTRAAAMTDPGVMPREERNTLLRKLNDIDPRADYFSTLEEEQIDNYDTTRQRIKAFTDQEFAEELEKGIEEALSHKRIV